MRTIIDEKERQLTRSESARLDLRRALEDFAEIICSHVAWETCGPRCISWRARKALTTDAATPNRLAETLGEVEKLLEESTYGAYDDLEDFSKANLISCIVENNDLDMKALAKLRAVKENL